MWSVQRQVRGDCVDMAPAATPRDDILVSFLLVLRQARQRQLGPSLRHVVHAPQSDVCRYLGYRSVRHLLSPSLHPSIPPPIHPCRLHHPPRHPTRRPRPAQLSSSVRVCELVQFPRLIKAIQLQASRSWAHVLLLFHFLIIF